MDHIEFEKKLMDMLLEGDDPVLNELKNQYIHSTVESRKFTGVGFFTHYKVKRGVAPAAEGKTFQIGDIYASYKSNEAAFGFLLFVRDGYLLMLEGYNYGEAPFAEAWPKEYSQVSLLYNGADRKRDFGKLKAAWS